MGDCSSPELSAGGPSPTSTRISRIRAYVFLGILGIGAGGAALAACAPEGGGTAGSTSSATTSAAAGTLTEMKSETRGPCPGDGSNGPDVLDMSGVERSDIRSSIGPDVTAKGVPLTLTMILLDMTAGNAPMAGAAVYMWHCDAPGRYSMYDSELLGETYLRGVQVADRNGQVTFRTILPGCGNATAGFTATINVPIDATTEQRQSRNMPQGGPGGPGGPPPQR